MGWKLCGLFAALAALAAASWYDEAYVDWNLNTNKDAKNPLQYRAPSWPSDHKYQPSPDNWRMPFYSFFPDRYVNGDPSNDNINGTSWEHDMYSTQLRHGGDVRGLQDSLDYLYGLGIRGIYLVGSALLNHPWEADQYSPYDHTILDQHLGTIQQWRECIQAIHDRGMYVVFDNTMATMSDLFAFQGYHNSSAPWSFTEHKMSYKSDTIYRDYTFSNKFEDTCTFEYPRFWDQGGHRINDENTTQMVGCMDSEFDQYGEVGAFGVYPEWQKQLSKFNGVQDRLREWKPDVLEKINHFSCMVIQGLDIDGWRMDKAMQITVDALGNFSNFQRECARNVGKYNFMVTGEIVNGNANGAIYLGRGLEPEMAYMNQTAATITNTSRYIRDWGHQALDSAAFHYSVYRGLMRFLGLDGNLLAAHDAPPNFQEQWGTFLETNDMINANTGQFDPRHMYGASNQDVLRWPGLTNGTERQILAHFVVTLLMPGIPLISWGEEQAFYVLDNTATNYVYGRQAMSSAQAWQNHGCHYVEDINLHNAPFNSTRHGCQDDSVSLDHRDPSAPLYGFLKHMFELRDRYPVLNDGWNLTQLSNQTFNYTLPGSFNTPTETGLWSVFRARIPGAQDLDGKGHGNQPVWMLYTNYNGSRTYSGDCDSHDAIVAPFQDGTTVKNLVYPFEEYTLDKSGRKVDIAEYDGLSTGCLKSVDMPMYGWKAFVPIDEWSEPSPVITKFLPGHDARILSAASVGGSMSVDVEIRFSQPMDCNGLKNALSVTSHTEQNTNATVDESTMDCLSIDAINETYYHGPVPSVWRAKFSLKDVYDGIHVLTVDNMTTQAGNGSTGGRNHFMLRVGHADNPLVFPKSANYSTSLLYRNDKTTRSIDSHPVSKDFSGFYIQHKAPGADKWRFSMSFGAVWSDWMPYKPGRVALPAQEWKGQKGQGWKGDHVQVQYWSSAAGSSDHMVEGDVVGSKHPVRRFPHMFVHGSFNQYGYDAGRPNRMHQDKHGIWNFDFMDEWPSQFQLNVWGMAKDGSPDVSHAFGDVDNDTVLDRIPPTSLQMLVTNITDLGPPSPYLGWRILFNDGDYRYRLHPIGNRYLQLIIWCLFIIVPVLSAILGVVVYVRAFYGVKFNQIGLSDKKDVMPVAAVKRRRTVLIGTMEYDISDWNIKIKIGGLGVMAQLMGKNLQHQDLVWVVPCAGGVEYPVDTPGLPIDVTILGRTYEVQVQYHKLNNITYMLLDAPVFRRQTKEEPYPARMDDLDSAIYYSAWNQCIAEAMRRFPIDLYHINDYHGTIAPLYLLPDTIPCCLSLHNAEFQGLWPMRNPKEVEEICSVYNLPQPVVQRYVQFGEVFNLLHAGASILRIHQKGFGAVGVSKKYGKRSWARYPIFWGLKKIGALPNPDPSDVAEWDKKLADPNAVTIDPVYESGRAALKQQAQEWAGLEQREDADLFVFVGRWSMQKGIDLIADVFPAVLEQYPHTQLLCVGPTIDLYGKFAALKLETMMKKYPGRVYSKPVFTALPPFIFSGAEFALIPSRDEPFGLVAVEFGRKGALGVGSRVGGLGQMPGWWYTIESTTTKHQMHQFKMAIAGALKSSYETRALMRARSAKQRFPVAQWKEDLEILQTASIQIHKKQMDKISARRMGMDTGSAASSGWNTPNLPGWMTPRSGWATPTGMTTPTASRPGTRSSSPTGGSGTSTPRNGALSLGMRHGPGHVPEQPPPLPTQRGPLPNAAALARRSSFDEEDRQRRRMRNGNEDEEIISTERAEEAKRRDGAGSNYPFLSHPHTPLREEMPMMSQEPLATERVMDEKKGQPQELTPFFTDPTGLYYKTFEKRLESLNGKNSESQLCIEEYLEKSEKEWFNRLHIAKMSRNNTPGASKATTPAGSIYEGIDTDESMSQFLLPENYQPPTGVRRLLMTKVGDWPLYSFLLALGQIIAANSYQITLITGQVGQKAEQLYAIAGIYLITTLIWWFMFRRLASRFALSIPFVFYGLAFFLLAFAPWSSSKGSRAWVQNVATGMYAIASSSGSLFFAQNFGSVGSAPVKDWAFRACAIQGTQQLYAVGLWAWGDKLTSMSAAGKTQNLGAGLTAIGIPISLLMWGVGAMLFLGLSDFYRQKPGAVPDFYSSIMRRKIVLWFWIATFVQNIFLSAQYGRTWSYLFSSKHLSDGATVGLVFLFFGVFWAAFLWYASRLSDTHSWFLPLFAVGLLAPRWAQEWWASSTMGSYLPWAGGPIASAILGRSLWLWLGLLDEIQGVGIGMLLLQTMVRAHITWALMAAQVIGSIATIIARADGLNSVGPGPTFPSIAGGLGGLANCWFWICLVSQLAIPIGYFTFFRKEQLSKP
ncbi:glycosyltransferase family 5 protein [Piedraia hortae CBS 480.64]|uniref:alpha-1,3-glucan synthase n=1 Tax=Piedraia hortae CBS 480.64 TaxID=1314780 RepID=A0A6A7BXX3_9PEZI|nr:glycosyltransferase family 5 protein [Piedraia hortae CBS 480.64]